MRSFGKKILNSMVVGARQTFKFFKEKAWFSKTIALSKFLYGVSHYHQIIIKSDHKKTILY